MAGRCGLIVFIDLEVCAYGIPNLECAVMVSSLKKFLFAAVLFCVAVLLLFHFYSRLPVLVTPIISYHSWPSGESNPLSPNNTLARKLARTFMYRHVCMHVTKKFLSTGAVFAVCGI